ncbi:hypothetical protein [Nonomuraea recticatena]|uniref:hypothetical protein n=1 Tax=Nonomuraea recticatena TaxID=46178 RepID=UPI00360C5F17
MEGLHLGQALGVAVGSAQGTQGEALVGVGVEYLGQQLDRVVEFVVVIELDQFPCELEHPGIALAARVQQHLQDRLPGRRLVGDLAGLVQLAELLVDGVEHLRGLQGVEEHVGEHGFIFHAARVP